MRVAISVSIGLAIGVLALPAHAREATTTGRTVLADLRQETGDTSTRLVIAGSAKPSFTHHSPDPLTVVVDIADADSTRLPARLEVATREVESLRVYSLVRGDGRTTARVEVRLAAMAPYTVEEAGNDVVITVSRPAPARPAALPAPEKAAPPAAAPVRIATPVFSTDAAPKATRISGVTRLTDGQTGYHVAGNGTLRPEAFFLKNPNRLVLDFPEVVTVRGPSLPEAIAPVKAMRLAQFSAAPPRVARLVLEVDGRSPYRLVPDANGVAIVFGEGAPAAPALLGAPSKLVEPEVTIPVVQKEPVPLESPAPAQAAPASAPSMQSSAASAVAMNPSMKPTVIAEPIAPQTVTKNQGMASASEAPGKFTGHPISLDFKDGDIIDLFRLMSEISGLNIIVNPGISGKVSLSVKEVPWDQALDLILKTQGLGYTVDGNVVRIAKLADLKREEQEMRDLKKEKELSGTLITWQGRLSYLDTALVKGVIEKTVLSDKGVFIELGAGNVFVITDLPEKVAAAQRMIGELDRPALQVEIEARIVITSRDYARALGIQWGFLNQQVPQYGNTTNLGFPNSIVLNGQSQGSVVGEGLATNAGIGQGGRGYMVNLPVPATTGIGVSMGNILGSFNLDAALSAAENSGKVKTISRPRITAQNKKAAEIKQGTQIPYQTVSNGTVTTAFKDATLALKVTPTISEAGTILMEVVVENNSRGTDSLDGPTIDTQSASTSVMVKDGATTVLGGVAVSRESISGANTPFLSKIPILGMLFKNNQRANANFELLIFITPRIVR